MAIHLPRLLQLALDNREAAGRGVRAESKDDEATVYVSGVIGGFWGDISATAFDQAMRAITSPTIHLRINSPGGDVFEARAMMTTIAQHKSKVIGHVDGLAASAATDLVMACAEAEISKGARFMIHNAWTLTMGDKHEHKKVEDLLIKIDDDIADDYQKRTGKDRAQIVTWMDAETWFSAQEAVDNGFVDRLVEVVKGGAANSSRWNLSAYKNVPKDLIDAPAPPAAPQYDFAALQRRMKLLENVAA